MQNKLIFILSIQIFAFLPYVVGTVRMRKSNLNNPTKIWVGLGIACDIMVAVIGMGVRGSTNNLGNSSGAPWGHPLFLMHVFFALTGFICFLVLFVLLFLRHSKGMKQFISAVAFPVLSLWIIGVGISILNVLFNIY